MDKCLGFLCLSGTALSSFTQIAPHLHTASLLICALLGFFLSGLSASQVISKPSYLPSSSLYTTFRGIRVKRFSDPLNKGGSSGEKLSDYLEVE